MTLGLVLVNYAGIEFVARYPTRQHLYRILEICPGLDS